MQPSNLRSNSSFNHSGDTRQALQGINALVFTKHIGPQLSTLIVRVQPTEMKKGEGVHIFTSSAIAYPTMDSTKSLCMLVDLLQSVARQIFSLFRTIETSSYTISIKEQEAVLHPPNFHKNQDTPKAQTEYRSALH
ncbi:Uncharacterized protein Fot_50854 [Forsythia ovata]|uniref:Uncharacterized protein n=1 Tax=Forsythia ovata TaxID=205694 RepID=A0ABD1PZB4_9LAMI